MTRAQQPALTFFAIGLAGLGILALIYGDFALVWQPVAPWVPGRAALAYASGVLMLGGGIGLLFHKTAAWAARILFPYLILWALLKVPAVCAAPLMEAVWLGLGELTVLLAGGWVLFAGIADIPKESRLAFLTGEKALRAARILFAVSLIPIGLSHFFYLQATIDLVPAWLPFRAGWGRLTGIGHIAAGLGVLFSVVPGLAGLLETGMIWVFTLFVWLPRIIAEPHSRLPWTAFFISWIIGTGAWLVAQDIVRTQRSRQQ